MKKNTRIILTVISALAASAPACGDETIPGTLDIHTPAFADGEVIPADHTCYGRGESPALFIAAPPDDTAMFALVAEDLDARDGLATLWIVWSISSFSGEVAHGIPRGGFEAGDYRQGRADDREVGYLPPCPESGKANRIRFRAFALDGRNIAGLDHAVDRAAFDHAVDGHVLATGTLTGIAVGY